MRYLLRPLGPQRHGEHQISKRTRAERDGEGRRECSNTHRERTSGWGKGLNDQRGSGGEGRADEVQDIRAVDEIRDERVAGVVVL